MIASSEQVPQAEMSSSAIADLSEEQLQRLTQLLDQYLLGLEQSERVNVDQLIQDNPDLADVLQAYLAKLDGLHGIAAGFQSHGELEPLISGQAGSAVRSLQLGDYTIVRELGRGGMGIVYEAEQRALKRRVALKLLPLASMLDERQIARFKNESHAAAQIQHPNIVPIYCLGVERGIHYYAMQYVDGPTIDDWISSSVDPKSSTQWRETVRIAIDVADALHSAHASGVVHRDIKPSNLMLDQTGKPWVTDFGLARCQNDLSLTLSGHLVGTMRYMSPEQAEGRAELVDHRSDIYSLGATLYEMLTGHTAISAEDSASVLREIVSSGPPRIRKVMRQLPGDLEVVIQKAMSKEKDDRYASAGDFARDLTAILEGKPIKARPLSIPTRLGRWATRHSKVVATALMVIVLGMVGLTFSLVTIAQKNRELAASKQKSDSYFHEARATVERLGRYESRLAAVPGTHLLRQDLLQDILTYHEQFAARAAGDTQSLRDLAHTYNRIGTLVRELESAEASIPHHRRAAEIYEQLASSITHSSQLDRQTADNLNELGLALAATGQHSEALQTYEKAIELRARISSDSDDVMTRTELALTRNNLGLLLRERGENDRATEEFKRAIVLLLDATRQDDEQILAHRALAAALINLGSLTTDTAEEIRLLRIAIDHQNQFRNLSDNPLNASSEIATTHNNLGAAYLQIGQPQQAIDAFSNAISIQRQIRRIAPQADSYREQLALSLNNLAKAFHEAGEYPRAKLAASEAVDLQLKLLQQNPSAATLSLLGVMYNNLGSSMEAVGEGDAASLAFASAVEHQQAAIAEDPDAMTYRRYLLKHYSNLLGSQIRQRRWREAELTSDAYRLAAVEQPQYLLEVAEDMARLANLAPTGSRHERVVSSIAATLLAARHAGVEFDSSLLLREPFRSVAHHPSFRRAVQP